MEQTNETDALRSEGLRFAAIDIGTNAVRLLLSRVLEDGDEPLVKKESLVRIPIRLGEDVFSTGSISAKKIQNLTFTMLAYKNLMKAYGSIDYMACATSAMREAKNGAAVVKEIRERTDIDLIVIDGRLEAEIICRNRPQRSATKGRPFLYMDVGGGSTELAIFSENHVLDSRSFKIGGVRILSDSVDKHQWKEMKQWVKTATEPYRPLIAVGSGGNINKSFRMAGKKEGESISYKKLNGIFKELCKYSYSELIHIFQLRPDRADVIVPALDIYLSVMKWARIKEMLVPQQGLSDGLVHLLYDRYRAGNKASTETLVKRLDDASPAATSPETE